MEDCKWPGWKPRQVLRANDLMRLEEYVLLPTGFGYGGLRRTHGVHELHFGSESVPSLGTIRKQNEYKFWANYLKGITPEGLPVWLESEINESVVTDNEYFDLFIEVNPEEFPQNSVEVTGTATSSQMTNASSGPGSKSNRDSVIPDMVQAPPKFRLLVQPISNPDAPTDLSKFPRCVSLGRYLYEPRAKSSNLVMKKRPYSITHFAALRDTPDWSQWTSKLRSGLNELAGRFESLLVNGKGAAMAAMIYDLVAEWESTEMRDLQRRFHTLLSVAGLSEEASKVSEMFIEVDCLPDNLADSIRNIKLPEPFRHAERKTVPLVLNQDFTYTPGPNGTDVLIEFLRDVRSAVLEVRVAPLLTEATVRVDFKFGSSIPVKPTREDPNICVLSIPLPRALRGGDYIKLGIPSSKQTVVEIMIQK